MVLWRHELVETIETLALAGFDAIELWTDHLLKTGESTAVIARALNSAGLRCTVHCPIIDLNICSTNQAIADTSLRLYLEALETAQELGALLFVFHAGNLFSSFDPLEEYWRQLDRALEQLSRRNTGGVLIVVENMEIDKPQEVVKTAEDIQRVLAAHAGAGLGVCWDSTHLVSSEANLRFLDRIPRIDHVHLSDAEVSDTTPARKHLRLGEGNLDLRRLLAHPQARQAPVVSLETVLVEPGAADLADERAKMQALLSAAAAFGYDEQRKTGDA